LLSRLSNPGVESHLTSSGIRSEILTTLPVRELLSAAMPQSTDMAPARVPARWPSLSSMPGLKIMLRMLLSPP
jgi:hypothetical protein